MVRRFSESMRRYLGKNSVVPLLLWRNCYYLGSPIGLSDTATVDLKLMLKTDIAEKSYRNKSQIYEDIVELLLDRCHEIYYLQA
ncbi:MAG: hypothetical protein LDL47_02770 [Cyanobacteria bacterium KgW148]|nr:hypothetical protein [Cyanobacteria bacterium KgW148]